VDDGVCDKFYTCNNGEVWEMPCAAPLLFDSAVGSCVREENLSEQAKRCTAEGVANALKTIDGFTCPGKKEIGPGVIILF